LPSVISGGGTLPLPDAEQLETSRILLLLRLERIIKIPQETAPQRRAAGPFRPFFPG